MIALAFMSYYTYQKMQIVCFIVSGFILMIFEKIMIYSETLSIVAIVEAVLYNVALTICFISITMLFIYIGDL